MHRLSSDFLYFSVTYNDKTYFAGRDVGIVQYNITPQITYANSKGFYTGITGTYFSEFYPNWDVTVGYLGYNSSIGKEKLIKYNFGFSKYFYANELDNIFSNTLDFGVGIRTKNKILGTYFTGTYLFGKEQSFQISSRSYVSLNLIKNKTTSLKLRPQLIIITGKQTLELSRIISIDGVLTSQFIVNDVFDLINTQLSIPLQYTCKDVDLELGYIQNFPHPIGNETDLKTTAFIYFSLGYLIEL